MATMTESEIRRQVVDYLRMKGYFTFHLLQSLGCYRGAPDLIAVKGKTLFIELKKPGGRQSEYQKQFQWQYIRRFNVPCEKVIEEIRELEDAADLEDIAEEAFDVIQALTGYLITLGVDLPRANRRHINKLRGRERGR